MHVVHRLVQGLLIQVSRVFQADCFGEISL